MTYPGQYPPPAQHTPPAQPSAPAYVPAPVRKEPGTGVLLGLAIGGGATVLLAIAAVIALILVLPSAKIPSFDPFEGLDDDSYAAESDETAPPESCEGLCFSEADARTLTPGRDEFDRVGAMTRDADYDYYSETAGWFFDEQNAWWLDMGDDSIECSFVATYSAVWLESASSVGVRDQKIIDLGRYSTDSDSITQSVRVFDTVTQAEQYAQSLTEAIQGCSQYEDSSMGSARTYFVREVEPDTVSGIATTGWVDSSYPTFATAIHQYGNLVVMTGSDIHATAEMTIGDSDVQAFHLATATRLGALTHAG